MRRLWLLLLRINFVECQLIEMENIEASVNLSEDVSSHDYRLVNAREEWALKPYADIAERLLTSLKTEAPCDLIKKVIKKLRGISLSNETVNEAFLSYNKPYLALLIVFTIFAVILFGIGVSCCCLSYLGKCNLLPKESDPAVVQKSCQFIYVACLGVCGVVFIISGLIIVSGRQRFNEGVTLTRTLTDNAFKNLLQFQKRISRDLKFILITQMDRTFDELMEAIRELSRVIMDLTNRNQPCTLAVTSSLIDLDEELPSMNQTVSRLFDDLVKVQQLQKESLLTLNKRVNEINANLSITEDLCLQNATLNSSGLCPSPDFSSTWQLLVNMSTFEKVSNSFVTSLARVAERNLTDLARTLNFTVKIYGATVHRRIDFYRIARILKHRRNSTFEEIESLLLHKISEAVISKEQGVLKEFENNGLIGMIVNIVNSIMLASLIYSLVVGFLLINCVLVGVHVMISDSSGKRRGFLAKFAYGLTLNLFHQMFLFSFPMVIILGLMVAFCGSLTQICIGLKNNSILENVGDDAEIWGSKLFGLRKIVPNIPDKIETIQFIDACGQSDNATIWRAARIYETFNIRKKWQLDKLEDPINFFRLGTVFDAGDALSRFLIFKESVDNLTKGLSDLNSTMMYTGPLLIANLEEYGANLTVFSKKLQLHDMELATVFDSWSRKVANEAKVAGDIAARTEKETMGALNSLIAKGKDVLTKVEDTEKSVRPITKFIKDVKQKFISGMKKAVLVIDHFIGHVEKEINENVGKCGFIKEAYVKGRLVYCSYVVGGLNVIWLSLGVAAFLFTAFLGCFVKVIYYHRMMMLRDGAAVADVRGNWASGKGSLAQVADQKNTHDIPVENKKESKDH